MPLRRLDLPLPIQEDVQDFQVHLVVGVGVIGQLYIQCGDVVFVGPVREPTGVLATRVNWRVMISGDGGNRLRQPDRIVIRR